MQDAHTLYMAYQRRLANIWDFFTLVKQPDFLANSILIDDQGNEWIRLGSKIPQTAQTINNDDKTLYVGEHFIAHPWSHGNIPPVFCLKKLILNGIDVFQFFQVDAARAVELIEGYLETIRGI